MRHLVEMDARAMPDRISATAAKSSVGYTPAVIRPGMPTRGWFITLEGPEGAGKTTQAEALVAHLAARGVDVHLTREPGGTWLGERLREVLLARTTSAAPTDPLTDAFLFNAARRQLVTEVIRPALEAGRSVALCPLCRLDAGLPGLRRGRPARPPARARTRGDRRPAARPHDPA